jgi:choline dehydrogenase
VTAVHELPGVGKHLEDHLCMPVVFRATAKAVRALSRAGLVMWLAQHLAAKKGPLATSPVEAGAFVRSHGAARPDHQFHFIPAGLNGRNTDEPLGLPFGRFATILPGLIYPRSRGELRLASQDPEAAPLIDPKYFSDPADLDHLVEGVRMTREIAATEPLASLLGEETLPGPQAASEEQVRDAIRLTVNTIFHPVGTCRMGPDGVVDHELRVRGIAGLRVADASIMPSIVGGNTNAPVIMIAEKAADMLLAAR